MIPSPNSLNLAALARSACGARIAVPGTDLEAQELNRKQSLQPERQSVLLLIAGQVVVDLPNGAFRVLDAGHSLVLPAQVPVSLQPIGGPAIVVWTKAAET